MAYILFVNPITLALDSVKDFPEALRIDQGAVFTATALASAAGCILMGLIARYPIAIAPGMGLNAFCVFCCPWYGHFMAGSFVWCFYFRSYFRCSFFNRFSWKIINAIPPELKLAVGAGLACLLHSLVCKAQESLLQILLRLSRSETFTVVLCC